MSDHRDPLLFAATLPVHHIPRIVSSMFAGGVKLVQWGSGPVAQPCWLPMVLQTYEMHVSCLGIALIGMNQGNLSTFIRQRGHHREQRTANAECP